LLLSAAPVWLISVAVCFWLWPWHQAVAHLAVLGLLGIILADVCLWGFRKIPFTCSYLPGKLQVHMIVVAAVILILLVAQSVVWEQEALQKPEMMGAMVALLGVAAIGIRWRIAALAMSDGEGLQFADEVGPAVRQVGLYRDVVVLGTLKRVPPSVSLTN